MIYKNKKFPNCGIIMFNNDITKVILLKKGKWGFLNGS